MIKILIADTDIDNAKNFNSFIKTNYPLIKNIKTITDSTKNIFNFLINYTPEIIIADVKFFGISSYQTMKSIYELYPKTKIILYGTINEAEYLKKFMEFGVINYMYRPVKPNELKKAIDNVIYLLKSDDLKQKEEDTLKVEYLEDIKLFEEKFLNNLLQGYLKDDNEIYRSFKYFNFEFKENYCVFIVRIQHFKKIILTLDEMEKHLLIFKVLNTVNKNINIKTCKATISNLNTLSVIMSGDLKLEDIVAQCEKIKNSIFEDMQIRVTMGVGRIYEKPSDIPISYNEANGAIRYRFYLGNYSIIPIYFVEPLNNITYRYPLEKEERLVYTAVIGEYDYCKILLDEIFSALRDCGELPDKIVPKIIMDILISISRFASEQNVLVNNKFSSFFSFKECLEIKNLEEAYLFLDSALKNFCGYVVSEHEKKEAKLFEDAKEYLKLKYYENISLAKVALYLGTTPEYLNNIFKKIGEKSFFEYAIFFRLEVAKKYMRETDLDDEMIALKVGYMDAKHFRSVFKQYEYMNTNEYRIRSNPLNL